MKINKANKRGTADFGWLQARYSFSFANYYNPENIHFGTLRVLNDDIVAPNEGFGTHPHENMEIITIPLKGALAHKDNTGGDGVIQSGQIQVMSAGTGVTHSEFNASDKEEVNLLQIWIFPKIKDVSPRYETIDYILTKNNWSVLVTPNKEDQGTWIHQDAYISLGEFDKDTIIEYQKKSSSNGLFTFVIEGDLSIDNTEVNRRDSIEWLPEEKFEIKSKSACKLLQIEVPMHIQ